MTRKSLNDAVHKPDHGEAGKAAAVAMALLNDKMVSVVRESAQSETVWCNLPVELIDPVRDLAEVRVVVAAQGKA